MPFLFPGVKGITNVVATGLQRLANWILNRLPDDPSRLQFLRQRYPDAAENTIAAALNRINAGAEAAARAMRGEVLSPVADIPRDPTMAAYGRYIYQVNMNIMGYRRGSTGRGRPVLLGERFHVFFSDQLLTPEQVDAKVIDWAVNHSDLSFVSGSDPEGGRVTSAPYTIVSVNRS